MSDNTINVDIDSLAKAKSEINRIMNNICGYLMNADQAASDAKVAFGGNTPVGNAFEESIQKVDSTAYSTARANINKMYETQDNLHKTYNQTEEDLVDYFNKQKQRNESA